MYFLIYCNTTSSPVTSSFLTFFFAHSCIHGRTNFNNPRRPPTLLVHGLCIRVRHRETARVLRVKRSVSTSSKKDEWAAVCRQGLRGFHLRMGTKREVASALATTFASRVQERDWTRYASTPLDERFRSPVELGVVADLSNPSYSFFREEACVL